MASGKVLYANRCHDAFKVEGGIIFDKALLHRVAHDFRQILTHAPGTIMNTLAINRLHKLRQMPGFYLRNIHCGDIIRKDIAIQAGENFICMSVRPEFQAAGVPCSSDMPKGALIFYSAFF
ncbi:hypothetical protein HF650_20240 [Kosakonia sp. SMBL-WEM22]|nr:hypothetical protein HF650_20240 [Kosakonia sp. SMBL-WEM22]